MPNTLVPIAHVFVSGIISFGVGAWLASAVHRHVASKNKENKCFEDAVSAEAFSRLEEAVYKGTPYTYHPNMFRNDTGVGIPITPPTNPNIDDWSLDNLTDEDKEKLRKTFDTPTVLGEGKVPTLTYTFKTQIPSDFTEEELRLFKEGIVEEVNQFVHDFMCDFERSPTHDKTPPVETIGQLVDRIGPEVLELRLMGGEWYRPRYWSPEKTARVMFEIGEDYFERKEFGAVYLAGWGNLEYLPLDYKRYFVRDQTPSVETLDQAIKRTGLIGLADFKHHRKKWYCPAGWTTEEVDAYVDRVGKEFFKVYPVEMAAMRDGHLQDKVIVPWLGE